MIPISPQVFHLSDPRSARLACLLIKPVQGGWIGFDEARVHLLHDIAYKRLCTPNRFLSCCCRDVGVRGRRARRRHRGCRRATSRGGRRSRLRTGRRRVGCRGRASDDPESGSESQPRGIPSREPTPHKPSPSAGIRARPRVNEPQYDKERDRLDPSSTDGSAWSPDPVRCGRTPHRAPGHETCRPTHDTPGSARHSDHPCQHRLCVPMVTPRCSSYTGVSRPHVVPRG